MRVLMGIVKNEHGTYHVRRKVPDKLQVAVAQITESVKPKVSWLKKSLGTKDASKANVRAKPVMMDHDKIIAQAEASLKQRPVQSSLSDAEIKRIAAYHYTFSWAKRSNITAPVRFLLCFVWQMTHARTPTLGAPAG